MALASVGTLGSANEKTSDTAIVITTSATLEAGNLGVCAVAWNNIATADGASTNIDTCVDSAGNTWTKVAEYTETSGVALDGVTVALFYTVAVSQLSSGGTITVTADTAATAKAATAWEFTKGSGTITVAAETVTQAHDVEPADAALSSLTSREYLWFHAMAQESGNVTITQTGWTPITRDFSIGGGSQTNVQIGGGFQITTATGITATVSTNDDNGAHAYILAAFYVASTGAFTLDCQPATFAITGTAATLARQISLNAAPATFAITGTAMTPTATRVMSADPASFAITGAAATLAAGRLFHAEPAAYTITGVASTLEHATPGVYTLAADPAAFSITGAAATVTATRVLSADPATYAITGVAAQVGRTPELNALPASYTLTGVAATFAVTRALVASPAAFAITGADATLASEGQAPNMDEILTGWIAGPTHGSAGGGTVGRIRQPETGVIA